MLTREDILAMVPGRELDALVAEKVMGWEVNPHNPDYHIQYTDEHGNPYGMQMSDFEPSTDISAAWEVVEKMRDERFSARRMFTHSLVRFMNPMPEAMQIHPSELIWYINPERICKAALLSILEGGNEAS